MELEKIVEGGIGKDRIYIAVVEGGIGKDRIYTIASQQVSEVE